MGASRKLQGEIDRVLKKVQEGVDVFDSIWNKVYDTDNVNQKEKFEADLKKEIKKLQRYRDQIKTWIQSSEIKDKKVSASYEQSLVDARKLIEREMERFKICEKETKTKAFSKEGLGQQPKTDPKEKAKSETRDWLNNVVSELESQIDSFEAELEGLSVKKGKTRPPRLTHLETSITRHRDHIIKLELILRLLDNDELSPEQVNDVKDFLDDYVERNQDDFDEFCDVDELYSTLPLDEVEGLEDLVTAGPLVKGTPLSMKSSLAASASQVRSISLPTHHQSTSQEKTEDSTLLDSSSETVPKTPPPKNGASLHSAPSTPAGGRPSLSVPASNVLNAPVALSTSIPVQTSTESMGSLSPVAAKEEDATTLLSRKPPSSVADAPLRGIGRVGIPNQPQPSQPPSPIPANGSRISATSAAEVAKRNIMGVESNVQPLTSPLSKMVLPPTAKGNDGTVSDSNPGDVAASIGRAFSPSIVSGSQWRPGSPFQSQNETVRGRTEIAPDQREKFLQRLQQVQQGHGNLLGIPSLAGGNEKQFSSQQQNPLLQQSSSISPHGSLGIGVQAPGFNVMGSTSLQQQSNAMTQQLGQQPSVADVDHARNDDQLQQNLPDETTSITTSKTIPNEDDSKVLFDTPSGMPSYMLDPVQVSSGPDFSPGQPIQPGQSSSSLGVIGRRSNSELDQMHNLQMLEAAFLKRPQPIDSERPRPYSPRNPAITPQTFPQTQAPIINNPLLWERLGSDGYGTDTLFFAFYYQQNSYQQYLAAKELKKQSWRYHRKFNTWFQRHKEPKIATDEYEQGAYVYFDFQTPKDENQEGGWCQRIKNEFTFEYSYLEDELVV